MKTKNSKNKLRVEEIIEKKKIYMLIQKGSKK